MRYLSPRHVLSLAAVVGAVEKQARVRWATTGGEVMMGTVRGFTTLDGGLTHSQSPDIRDSWIRITTAQGYDLWFQVEEIAGMYEEGAISL